MKKAIGLMGLILVFTSCSNDDTPQEEIPNDNFLVKRIIDTYENEEFIANYNYNGNRLLNITDEDGETLESYTYDNDLITRVDYLWADVYTTLVYDDQDNSIEITWYWDADKNPIVSLVEFNLDGTITVKNSSEGSETTNELVTLDTNGNILKIEDDASDYTNTFTYDNKHNPFKNVFRNEILQILWFETEYGGDYVLGGYSNNMTSWIESYEGEDDIETWEYNYNEFDYPESAIYFYEGEEEGTVQYFYE